MKIIVLDDEPIIRQGIIHKIQTSGLPLTIVGEAGNGAAGLEMTREARPDAILTDIQMPEMNGLEFIRLAKEIDPKLEFIILSGYDDFDYAKQAIRYGVSRYLLKPVENEELYEAINGLMEKLEADHLREKSYMELKLLEETSRETVRQQAMTQFIQQGDEAPGDEALKELGMVCAHFAAAVFSFEPFQLPHLSFAADEESLLWYAVKNIITEQFERSGVRGMLIQHTLHRYELVYVLGIGSASQQSSVKIALQDILQSVGRYLKLELTEAIGPYVDQFGRVQDSYREAKLLLRDAVIHGSNRIYSFNAAKQKGPNRKSIISGEDESTIIEMLKQGETDKIHRWTERRMGAIVQDPDSTYVHLEWFCMDLHLLFHKYLLARSLDSEWTIGETEDLLQWLSQVRHWEDVLEQMKRYTANIAGFLSKSGQMQETDMMEAIRQYIATHFGEPLSLQSISEKFFIHPNYFSRRFKEKNGTSFIELLTAYRMKEAETLLRGTELLVHQVAERVGFEDAAYFGSVFRKHYGMTPKQYREQEIS